RVEPERVDLPQVFAPDFFLRPGIAFQHGRASFAAAVPDADGNIIGSRRREQRRAGKEQSAETAHKRTDYITGRYHRTMKFAKRFLVEPGEKLRLDRRDAAETLGLKKNDATLLKQVKRLGELQHLLYADKRYALLIVLQALDAGGKDGTIAHVMSGVNPQGCQVTSFK